MSPSYTHRVLGGPSPRKLEANGIEIDIPIVQIASYCKENNLGDIERTFCCYCKPSFGAPAGPITRCPCHKLPCMDHAVCRKRAHHGAGCRRCKFHIPLAVPRTQVDIELLERQKGTLLSQLGSLNMGDGAQQAAALIRKYHEEEVIVLKEKLQAQGDRVEKLQAWASTALANGPSATGKDLDYEVTLLNQKLSALAGQFGQLEKNKGGDSREDQQYEVGVLDQKVSALALQIGQIKEKDSHSDRTQEYGIGVLSDKVSSLALQLQGFEAQTDDTSNLRHEVAIVQDTVSALALQVGQVEDSIKHDSSFRELGAKVDSLMRQQQMKEREPDLVHLGNGRMGPRPDGPSARRFY